MEELDLCRMSIMKEIPVGENRQSWENSASSVMDEVRNKNFLLQRFLNDSIEMQRCSRGERSRGPRNAPAVTEEKQPEFMDIKAPPPGEEFPRPVSPSPSIHSSLEDKNAEESKGYEMKRNAAVKEFIAKNSSSGNHGKGLELKGQKSKKCEKIIEAEVNLSDTSTATNQTSPRNSARNLNETIVGVVKDAEIYWRQSQVSAETRPSGQSAEGVQFSYGNFHKIIQCKWMLVRLQRVEAILEGKNIDCREPPEWFLFKEELQQLYGPMDMETEQFRRMVEELERQRREDILEMFYEENTIIATMLKMQKPSDCAKIHGGLQQTRFQLKKALSSCLELIMDSNPYTSREAMDFWRMPRPKETVSAYKLRSEQTDRLVEFNVPFNEKREDQDNLGGIDKQYVRKGYNTTIFDVGWHFHPLKVFASESRRTFFVPRDETTFTIWDKRKEYNGWRAHLLCLRNSLQKYRFGVEAEYFAKYFRKSAKYSEDEPIFGLMSVQQGIDVLRDIFFPQRLGDRIILFDAMLEGQIETPVMMLHKMCRRLHLLVDEQPEKVLDLMRFQNRYQDFFRQPFFCLNWGFKNFRELMECAHKLFADDEIVRKLILKEDNTQLEIVQICEEDDKWARYFEGDDGDDAEQREMNKIMQKHEHLFKDAWVTVEKVTGMRSF